TFTVPATAAPAVSGTSSAKAAASNRRSRIRWELDMEGDSHLEERVEKRVGERRLARARWRRRRGLRLGNERRHVRRSAARAGAGRLGAADRHPWRLRGGGRCRRAAARVGGWLGRSRLRGIRIGCVGRGGLLVAAGAEGLVEADEAVVVGLELGVARRLL